MTENRFFWPSVGFAVGVLLIGVVYWALPYNDESSLTVLAAMSLLVVTPLGVVLRVLARAPFWLSFLAAAATVPAVVMARIVVEVALDPTSHNLWPFEVVIAVVLGGFLALIGTGIGELLRRILDT
jgi:hypothetical protein